MRVLEGRIAVIADAVEQKTDSGIFLLWEDDNPTNDAWVKTERASVSGTVTHIPEKGWSITEELPPRSYIHPDWKHQLTWPNGKMIVKIPMPAPLLPGDKVFFDRNSISARLDRNEFADIDGVRHYFIPYDDIHFFVRDGKTLPVGQFIIAEPIPEDPDKFLSESGLLTKFNQGEEFRRGIVRIKGHDWMGGFQELSEGDTIVFNLKKKIPISVPGSDREFIRLRWRNILFAYKSGITEEELSRRIESNKNLREEMEKLAGNFTKRVK